MANFSISVETHCIFYLKILLLLGILEPDACTDENTIDVAIVGAGAAGTYSAWKLSHAQPDKTIHLFDANNRVGGRLLSVTIPDISDFKADVGAMRFKKSHTELIKVIKELGLTVQDFTTPTDDDTLFYFRNQVLGKDDIEKGNVPYNMTTEERKYTSDTTALRA